jgi:hypothetical protein
VLSILNPKGASMQTITLNGTLYNLGQLGYIKFLHPDAVSINFVGGIGGELIHKDSNPEDFAKVQALVKAIE